MNFLAMQDELVARLQQHLGALVPAVHVLCAADLAEVSQEKQLTPAVHVLYQGFEVLESRPDASKARIEQTWLAVVATRNVRTLKTGSQARTGAGTLASAVLGALLGFKAGGAVKPARLISAPHAGFEAGFFYLPLAFGIELMVHASG